MLKYDYSVTDILMLTFRTSDELTHRPEDSLITNTHSGRANPTITPRLSFNYSTNQPRGSHTLRIKDNYNVTTVYVTMILLIMLPLLT